MSKINIKKELKKCLLFRKLDDMYLDRIASISTIKDMPRKNLIFSEGDESIGFYYLVKGSVKLFNLSIDGKEKIVYIIGPGEFFAETSAFSGGTHRYFAETKQKSLLLYIPFYQFKEILSSDVDISLKMLSSLTESLREFDWRVMDDLSNDFTKQLADYLISEFDEFRDQSLNSFQITLPFSKLQLASKLSTTSEMITRSFNKLSSLGILNIKGKKVTVLNSDLLFEISSIDLP